MGIESDRQAEFHCKLGPDVLMVRNFAGSERLGAPFEYVVTVYSKNHEVKLEALLGEHATVEVRFELTAHRYFDGIVSEFSYQGVDGEYAVYSLTLRPWLWLLTRNRDCRIFMNKTTLEIAREIFDKYGCSDLDTRLFVNLNVREYCVQYNESDFDFVNRLLEQEGIYYFFEHRLDGHTMVLVDSIHGHREVPGHKQIGFRYVDHDAPKDCGCFDEWSVTKQVVPGAIALNDFDFKKPRAELLEGRSNPRPHAHADSELYFYPGQYTDPAVGADQAVVRLEEALAPYDVARGMTNAKWLRIGAIFTLTHHPRKDQNRTYLVVGARYNIDPGMFHSGSNSTANMTTHVTLLESSTTFRPARVTPIPHVSGPQTARVVGPKGHEIWTDEYARVKVRFAWDRTDARDDDNSCWLRVSQTWAGSHFGSMYIPRVGQEVLVEFLDGDLDRPIVTGRLYNFDNRPPYDLPQRAAQSGIKTASIRGGVHDYNELRFDDTEKREEIVLRAQRNLTMQIRSNSSTSVGHDHTHNVQNDLKIVVAKGDYNATVSSGTMLNYVPKNIYDVCAKEIVQTADDAITFRVKETSIRLDGTCISINVGANTEIKLDLATLTIISPKVDINPIGGVPAGPANVSSLASGAGASSDSNDSGDSESNNAYTGGGGSFGGAGATGSY